MNNYVGFQPVKLLSVQFYDKQNDPSSSFMLQRCWSVRETGWNLISLPQATQIFFLSFYSDFYKRLKIVS